MKKVNLLWTVHFHQPLGNFGEVFEQYSSRVCRPFLAALERHPRVRVSLHFSGVLLTHLKKRQGDLLVQIGRLVRAGQVELLGGGFYEPILSMIPREDADLQLRKMAEWIGDEFGVVPRGAWLPESVWEPHFVELLHRAGYEYTVVEDSLFETVGWKRAQLFRAFYAHYLNQRLLLFPSHRLWSRQLPLEGLKEAKAAFVQLSNRPEPQVVTLAQNGEQYGLLPGTHAALHEKGALEEWLRYLSDPGQGIETRRFLDLPDQEWPEAALPGGASEGLEAYVLPNAAQRDFTAARGELARRYDADRFVGFFRGGAWLGFIGKYAEAKLMHGKLLWLRQQILELPPGHEREEAMEAILAAEEHSAYWHARSGGVHANYLRDAVHHRLIAAERLLYAEERDGPPQMTRADVDNDGRDEAMLRSALAGVRIVPRYGGSLCEYAFWPGNYNLANTFRRRVEAYHDAGAPPVADWYERRMFQDHFVPPNTAPGAFPRNDFVEHGDFIDQPYEIVETSSGRDAAVVVLERQGGLYFVGQRRPLACRKTFRMENPGKLTVEYTITNTSVIPTDVRFVSEVNYTCLSGASPDRLFQYGDQFKACGEEFNAGKLAAWSIEDGTRNLRWQWRVEPEAEVWHHPVHTVTLDRGRPETNYQGSALQIGWPLALGPGASATFRVVCEAAKLRD